MTTRLRPRTLPLLAVALLTAATTGGLQLARAATPAGTASAVVPVEPYRILDTRNGVGAPPGPLGPGATIDVQIAGVGPVPAEASGVVLNITGTRTSEATYITAWPTGGVQPTASVLNLTPGIDAPNGVTALLGDGGRLSLFNFTGTTDLIADVAGYLVGTTGGPSVPGPQGPAGPAGPVGPAGVSGYEVVGGLGTIEPGAIFGTDDVDCPSGKDPIGGGATTSNDTIELVESAPVGLGWRITYATSNRSPAGANRNFATWVICASFDG